MKPDSAWRRSYRQTLFEEIPCGLVIIDRHLQIVDHNLAFADVFGEGRGRPCHEVTRGRHAPCQECPAKETFRDGQRRTREAVGVDPTGKPIHHLVQIIPIRDETGNVPFVAAMTTDLSETKRLQREYQTLFEKVPCYVTVINRDFRVVKANEMFRRVFGEPRGERCYEMLKRRHEPCAECPAEQTFLDGGSHTSSHVGVTRGGDAAHYVVSTSPLIQSDGTTTHVIEMALDVTRLHHLETELERANALREALFEHSPDAILILDRQRQLVLANQAAERLWGMDRRTLVGRRLPRRALACRVDDVLRRAGEGSPFIESAIVTESGEEIPVRLSGFTLRTADGKTSTAIIAQDLREIRTLEREKLDAERLAAVGQTVAGLAHGIKNILTGLEGGMYVTSGGLARHDEARVKQGWAMLERNIGRVSALVKNLLAFSRGDQPQPKMVRPAAIVADVVSLFRELSEQHNVTLVTEIEEVAPASMDAEGIHTCLANLISNALDACLVSHKPTCLVRIGLREEEGDIVFEVADTGCGMDYEVKQKAFTSFFTTKGSGGTGLGLLLTRKIVQQHGGSVTFESSSNEGTTFRLRFPRRRLPPPTPEEQNGR